MAARLSPARLSPAGLRRLHDVARRHVGDTAVPGLVYLVAAGDEVQVEALGRLGLDREPVSRTSMFRIASTTKPITAALILALVGEGLLRLDEPVDRWLPELADRRVLRRMDGPLSDTVPAARPITTRDLLTFTFGLGIVPQMFAAEPAWPLVQAERELRLGTFGPPDPDLQPDPDTWIARLGTLPLLAQPGERWAYNTAAAVLGVLAARVAGQPLPDALHSRVLEPLGMADTAFWTPHTHRLATAYQPTPDGLVEWDPPDGAWSRPPAFADGAAGLVSTVDDLLAFARMLLRGGAPVMTRAAAEAMTSDQLTAAQKAHGGLGPGFFHQRSWGFGQAVLADGSYGWDGGLGCSWLVDPRADLVVIALTQRLFESPDLPQVHADVRAAARQALE